MNEAAIEIRGLEKTFSAFKLGPLDITVPPGAIYGLIGPNGAGKTTTINLIMGMGRNEAGTIRIFGLDHIKDEVAMKRQVGYVTPEIDFKAWGRVRRLVRFMSRFYDDWDPEYCAELKRRFGIYDDDVIHTLSFGQKVRLHVILALAHHPRVLLLDEPFVGLDAVARRDLYSELLSIVQDEQRTVLISSHDLAGLERFADHLGIIKNGRMLVEGPTADLLERFRMVHCALDAPIKPGAVAGVYPQESDGNRWRLLVDRATDALDRLRERNAKNFADAPVSLDDLFVALMKGPRL